MIRRPPRSTLFPYTTLCRSQDGVTKKSLYDRLGGYNAVAAVVDDFVGRLVTDKQFERFFAGHSNDSKKRIRQHIVDQLCAAARSEEHTSELQSRQYLVCRLL